MKLLYASFAFLLITLCFSHCRFSSYDLNSNDTDYIINYSSFSPQIKIFHTSEDTSEFHIKLTSSDLLYGKTGDQSEFTAKIEVEGIIQNEETRDTISFFLKDVSPIQTNKVLYQKHVFGLKAGKNYSLSLNVIDLNRKSNFHTKVNIDKTSEFCQENFLVFSKGSVFPELSTYCRMEFPIEVYSERIDLSSVQTFSKSADLSLPPPPYSGSKTKSPDFSDFASSNVTQTSKKITITNPETFDFYIKDKTNQGLLFLFRPPNFPEISTPSELVLPLRYISAKREYEKMSQGSDIKKKIDEFWIECGNQ